ncbi:MAG: sigma-54-dependent Fis family transcriptional regulator, partial [Deltaproteobacteria bacterium]|nr:sigma-54-dependent Fis family transcriptional regulator [Deltaproteobacteria bacterium]
DFSPNLVITDLKMPDISGLDLLKEVRSERPEIDFIILTAYATVENAVEAMKEGALDYLIKPLKDPDELRMAVARVVERQTLMAVDILWRNQLAEGLPPTDVIFAGMEEVWSEIQHVAKTDATVLLQGESGTGKSLVAKAIHHLSGRKGPFVELNCAAIPETLIESELFGHEKGAFTGAIKAKRGRFELAQNGTIFLDEIGEMPLSAQAKFLRILQERTFERVGGTTTLNTSARIIAATNQDLMAGIREKRFREDLYYRLNVFPITLPPLRKRLEAIQVLTNYLVRSISTRVGKKVSEISDDTLKQIKSYEWPGNVRELHNVIERAIILSRDSRLTLPPLTASLIEVTTESATKRLRS